MLSNMDEDKESKKQQDLQRRNSTREYQSKRVSNTDSTFPSLLAVDSKHAWQDESGVQEERSPKKDLVQETLHIMSLEEGDTDRDLPPIRPAVDKDHVTSDTPTQETCHAIKPLFIRKQEELERRRALEERANYDLRNQQRQRNKTPRRNESEKRSSSTTRRASKEIQLQDRTRSVSPRRSTPDGSIDGASPASSRGNKTPINGERSPSKPLYLRIEEERTRLAQLEKQQLEERHRKYETTVRTPNKEELAAHAERINQLKQEQQNKIKRNSIIRMKSWKETEAEILLKKENPLRVPLTTDPGASNPLSTSPRSGSEAHETVVSARVKVPRPPDKPETDSDNSVLFTERRHANKVLARPSKSLNMETVKGGTDATNSDAIAPCPPTQKASFDDTMISKMSPRVKSFRKPSRPSNRNETEENTSETSRSKANIPFQTSPRKVSFSIKTKISKPSDNSNDSNDLVDGIASKNDGSTRSKSRVENNGLEEGSRQRPPRKNSVRMPTKEEIDAHAQKHRLATEERQRLLKEKEEELQRTWKARQMEMREKSANPNRQALGADESFLARLKEIKLEQERRAKLGEEERIRQWKAARAAMGKGRGNNGSRSQPTRLQPKRKLMLAGQATNFFQSEIERLIKRNTGSDNPLTTQDLIQHLWRRIREERDQGTTECKDAGVIASNKEEDKEKIKEALRDLCTTPNGTILQPDDSIGFVENGEVFEEGDDLDNLPDEFPLESLLHQAVAE